MKDAGGHGSDPRGGSAYSAHLPVWYHGSPNGFPHSTGPVHLGTEKAARQALEARIGVPADLKGWTGNREYGKTLLAGRDKLSQIERGDLLYISKYPMTGYNSDAPREDYYPKAGSAKYGDGTPVPMDAKPAVRVYQITGSMSNHPGTPYSDAKANGFAKAQQTRGYSKNGFFYKNIGEDEGSVSAVVPSRDHLRGQMG